ncbi:hypothetical protein [Luteolibacter sp.]|uniref:hypothetical protein n=1 Tax=Luteolibacter sp. TaxID=1962973 RepID=UPI00326530C7
MKNALLSCCVLPLLLTSAAHAGINGIYKVSGTETDNGKKYSFDGTVTVSKYKTGKYSLLFNDGDPATFTFTFSKVLKDNSPSQTVACSSSQGTGSATFKKVNGLYKVQFTYKAKGAPISGSGSGSK